MAGTFLMISAAFAPSLQHAIKCASCKRAGTVDHEIVSVPIATAYSLKSVSLRLIMGFEKFSGFIVNLKFLAVFIHLLLFSQWL
jgi:hypothetical protein